jgi:hypothetical protein
VRSKRIAKNSPAAVADGIPANRVIDERVPRSRSTLDPMQTEVLDKR